MLPLGARRPQKPNLLPSLMDKGLMALRRVANRDCRAQELKQCSLSSPAEAVNLYYRRLVRSFLSQEAGLEDRSFAQEMEELRKVFLRRPGCPQFCSRSTSMSHYGSATTVSLPEELCTCSEARKMTENSLCNQHGLDTQVDGRLLSLSKSACEFNYLGDRSESPVSSSPVLACSHLRKRIPWYMLVIHEKVPLDTGPGDRLWPSCPSSASWCRGYPLHTRGSLSRSSPWGECVLKASNNQGRPVSSTPRLPVRSPHGTL
uniref:Coiled-coil domain containing 27 n=1 Tax=Rhinolophus ferrumequinum TaxID=59479 RepID=A0A671ENI6_RHIFE